MDAGNCVIDSDCNVDGVVGVEMGPEVEINADHVEAEKMKVSDEGTQVNSNDYAQGFRKQGVVPVVEGSIGSSCGSQRSKLRLCVEMNIKSKLTGQDVVDDDDKCVDPVMVVVDYPDDVVVVVNAKIQKLERDPSVFSDEIDDVDRKAITQEGGLDTIDRDVVFTDQNQNKVFESTFTKVPLSSTMIYPILEENENDDAICDKDKMTEANNELEQQGSVRKSGSGDASFYHTVLGDNEEGAVGFGNISAIMKTGHENNEGVSEDLASANVLDKNPSTKLNSSSMLFKSEVMTPGEKLTKALHVLARYSGVWGIYEDETRIMKHLINLNRILTTTDKTTVYKTCKEEEHLEMRGLISYFTLEKRFVIRSVLLQTFTLITQKSSRIGSFISASDIPVVLAREVVSGECPMAEIYAYASYLLQMISAVRLSSSQCEKIGEEFYGSLCALIIKAEKKHYGLLSDILFDLLLHYHEQMGETDVKWQGLLLASENWTIIKKIKQKLTSVLLKNASLSPWSEWNQNEDAVDRITKILLIIHDFIACHKTRELFADAELDVILVTLIHNLENVQSIDFRREAVKTIHRSLVGIKTEPSGLDKLQRLVVALQKDAEAAGDHDKSYRGVLRKISKIVNVSLDMSM